MLYFIPWALFMLVVLLAVPIVSFLDKRKHRAAHPVESAETADPAEAWTDEEGGEVDELAGVPSGDPEAAEVVEFGEPSDVDEFADFDEIQ